MTRSRWNLLDCRDSPRWLPCLDWNAYRRPCGRFLAPHREGAVLSAAMPSDSQARVIFADFDRVCGRAAPFYTAEFYSCDTTRGQVDAGGMRSFPA